MVPARRVTDSVLLLFVRATDAVGVMIDRGSGGLGFGHVAICLGEETAHGQRLVVDCQPAYGAVRVVCPPWEVAEYELAGARGRWARDAVELRMGLPYALRGDGAVSCATLAYLALPPDLRLRVDAVGPTGTTRVLTPNQIARGLGLV